MHVLHQNHHNQYTLCGGYNFLRIFYDQFQFIKVHCIEWTDTGHLGTVQSKITFIENNNYLKTFMISSLVYHHASLQFTATTEQVKAIVVVVEGKVSGNSLAKLKTTI